MTVRNLTTMKRMTCLVALSTVVLAAACGIAAEPTAAGAKWPLWDGKESVADYAQRAGIKDVQIELDLGPKGTETEDSRTSDEADSHVVMNLTLIPAGKFIMGAWPDEFADVEGVRTLIKDHEPGANVHEVPQREVTISKPFYMGVYEVTQEQYLQIMKEIRVAGHTKLQAGTNLPVHAIGWGDAAEFCKKVSALTGKTVTLPTEAQWEYACRAGSGSKVRFCFGDDEAELSKYANYDSKRHTTRTADGKEQTHDDGFDGLAPIGSFKPNNFGLYDMHGNVSEHCNDWMGDDAVSSGGDNGRGQWKHSYKNAGTVDPTGPHLPNWYHVWRGGSWRGGPAHCRSAARPYHSGSGDGFRVVVAF